MGDGKPLRPQAAQRFQGRSASARPSSERSHVARVVVGVDQVRVHGQGGLDVPVAYERSDVNWPNPAATRKLA